VLNKVDLLPEEPSFAVEDERVLRVHTVSCATGKGIPELRRSLFELCPERPQVPAASEDGLVDFLVYRPKPEGRPAFRILRTDRGYRVVGTPPAGEEELEAALKAAGARRGHEVEVGEKTLVLS